MGYKPGIRPVILLNPRWRFALIRVELWWERTKIELLILRLRFVGWLRESRRDLRRRFRGR